MAEQALVGSLLVSVWWHGGIPIARIRGFRRLDAPQEDIGQVFGEEAIVEAVRAWLVEIRPLEP